MADQQVNQKITQALERISKAFRVLLWEESKTYKISPIQIQILIFCLNHDQEMLKVSFFAKEFDLTKATISDSVKVLVNKELLEKNPDTYDSRSYTVKLTQKGKEIALKTSGFTMALNQSVDRLKTEDKGAFLENLLGIINHLNQTSVISIQRMCLTCYHYSKQGNSHYCGLLNKALKQEDLQVDCPEHKPTNS